MQNQVKSILFDVGGTLRRSIKKDFGAKIKSVEEIIDLLGLDNDPQELTQELSERYESYIHWTRETLIELNENDLWTKWLFPDQPVDNVLVKVPELTKIWRAGTGIRTYFPETREIILELFYRGYRLGIVSNTITSSEVPDSLRNLEIAGCFETIILSCNVGLRKPGSGIMLEATKSMDIEPGNCAYIGNLLDRDVAAAREAGFGKVIIRRGENFEVHQEKFPDLIADYYIDDLKELLNIFPDRKQENHLLKYNISLSTMWSFGNFPALNDFFISAERMGFANIELNHHVDTAMLNRSNIGDQLVSSIHEPCPADISVETLKRRDWLISSTDEEYRKHGVEFIKRSIDLARELSAHTIVIHCGHMSSNMAPENNLRKLYEAHQENTLEYQETMREMIDIRQDLIAPCLDSVKKSLKELLQYASHYGIRLGLENRYHYFDIPSQDELAQLLELADPDQLGFIYDTGHAQAMSNLGFYPQKGWLERFSNRILGTHLHDVIGITDHFAPGLGNVDFKQVASYLPINSYRTMEIHPKNTAEQVKNGLKILADSGCIKTV